MALFLKKDTRNISFGGLSNPVGLMDAANANVQRVAPRIDEAHYSKQAGVIESGDVNLEDTFQTISGISAKDVTLRSNPDQNTSSLESALSHKYSPIAVRKKSKPKNTHKAKRKQRGHK